MSTTRNVLAATCVALASLAAAAQTAAPASPATPPTHPAASAAADTSSTGPTMPPTHPATAAGASGSANPSVNGYKESQPSAEDARRAGARTTSKPAPDAGSGTGRNPTSTDSMTKDNAPKHPATPAK